MKGTWKDVNYGKQFMGEDKVQFIFFHKKGRILVQGTPEKKEKLTRVFQCLIDNPDNLENFKDHLKEPIPNDIVAKESSVNDTVEESICLRKKNSVISSGK